MKTKICNKCGKKKSLNLFRKWRKQCIDCQHKYMKIWRKTNRIKLKNYAKIYYRKNKVKIDRNYKIYYSDNKEYFSKKAILYRQKNKQRMEEKRKEYLINNKEKINNYYKNRFKQDILFRIKVLLRNRIRNMIKRNKGIKSKNTSDLLGCSIENFKKYFQSKFISDMTWDKFMNGEIHIDHIKPCVLFDLSKPSEQKKCFNYKNLQPLWAKKNLSKGAKYGKIY